MVTAAPAEQIFAALAVSQGAVTQIQDETGDKDLVAASN
jgi:hypothetical protein